MKSLAFPFLTLFLFGHSIIGATALDCNDDPAERFIIDAEEGLDDLDVPCVWLSSRPEKQERYCDPSHESKAFYICQETCVEPALMIVKTAQTDRFSTAIAFLVIVYG